jgi:hypothetical protein
MNDGTVVQDTARYNLSKARHHEDAAAACARLLGSARDAPTSSAIVERMLKHREEARLYATAALRAESSPAVTAHLAGCAQ